MEMLKSAGTGKPSSKRIMGFVYMVIGLLMGVADQFTSYKIENFEVWLTIVLTGTSLIGLSLFEYFGKGKSIDIQKS